MQVIYLVPLRYPTEKAYGTNISYTAEAFSAKSHKVKILAPGQDSVDQRGNKVVGLNNAFIRIFQNISNSRHKNISRLGFYLSNIAFSLIANLKIWKNSEESLIITRSPITAFFIKQSRNKKILMEIHHIPSKFESLLLRIDNRKPNICVTNIDFKRQLVNLGVKNKIHIVPNAAPISFFELGKKQHHFDKPYVIGFAGKASSSGNSNDLDIALRLLKKYPHLANNFHFTFVGCEPRFDEYIKNMISQGLIPKESISTTEHLSNDELLQAISKFDLALIPYPENEYYERSFPIKIVEMSAAGIPMLASHTKAHIRILGESYKLFFSAGSEDSLKELLESITLDEQLVSVARKNIVKLAENFTYARKVELMQEIVFHS